MALLRNLWRANGSPLTPRFGQIFWPPPISKTPSKPRACSGYERIRVHLKSCHKVVRLIR